MILLYFMSVSHVCCLTCHQQNHHGGGGEGAQQLLEILHDPPPEAVSPPARPSHCCLLGRGLSGISAQSLCIVTSHQTLVITHLNVSRMRPDTSSPGRAAST